MTWTYPSELTAGTSVRLRLSRPQDAGTIAGWLRREEVHRWWGGVPVPLNEVVAEFTPTGERSAEGRAGTRTMVYVPPPGAAP